ncbi:hypothetical protein K435DRAFT_683318 [Dendrothele bispora CBS 962.96]|uniref:Ubiquitin-like domain-containing protein n=1 Tax=Dendrothele bispora (strain CBS 962.96) TaxID=1314807 RepID=A0A4S8LCK9_DENBC|nr:hypothetical protein K435DRAFT_683318 [Dendrothele bispora CBS 962.96]
MNIFIKTLQGQLVRFQVNGDTSLLSVIEEAQRRKDLPPGSHRLVYRGRQLDTARTVASYNIENKSILFVVPSLKGGGATHRGLAHAVVQCDWDGKMVSSMHFLDILPTIADSLITGLCFVSIQTTSKDYDCHLEKWSSSLAAQRLVGFGGVTQESRSTLAFFHPTSFRSWSEFSIILEA